MPTPFPGMDPYLESPDLWQGFHNRLISWLADDLAPRLRPNYFIAIEARLYEERPGDLALIGRADVAAYKSDPPQLHEAKPAYAAELAPMPMTVTLPMPDEIRETYLEVRSVGDNPEVIAVIEVLSPANKRQGEGRARYLKKRRDVLAGLTHLVEIDLLRAGAKMPMDNDEEADYRILVSRSERRPRADLYAFSVRQKIPVFPLPLQANEQEPQVDLNGIIHDLYDRAGYDLIIDYGIDATPPLSADDAAWSDELLQKAGLRP